MPPLAPTPKPAMLQAAAAAPEPAQELSAAPSRFVPSTMDEVLKTAKMFYDGGLMPRHFYEDKRIHPDNRRSAGIAGIATMILYGAELGLSPSQAMRMMHVIEGRAVLSSAGMVALIKRSPKCHYFRVEEASDDYCTVETQRRLDDGKLDKARRITVKIWWGDPKAIPEATKDTAYVLPSRDKEGNPTSPWARTPMRMLKARACSWVGNDVYEDVVAGLYSAEEVVDFRDNRAQSTMLDNIFDMVAETPVPVPAAGAPTGHENVEEEPVAPKARPQSPTSDALILSPAYVDAALRAELSAAKMVEDVAALMGRAGEILDEGLRRGFARDAAAKRVELTKGTT